jgi:hypothetical protein
MEMPVIPVDRVVDKKRIIRKMEGQGGEGEAQGAATPPKKYFTLEPILHTIVFYNTSVVNFYNASVVNFYNATGSRARFENKNILFYFEKRSSLLQRWRCSCKFKNRRIGSWGWDSILDRLLFRRTR